MSEQQAQDIEDASTGIAVASLSIDAYLFVGASVTANPAALAIAEIVSTILNLSSDALQIVGGIIELKDAKNKAQIDEGIENILFGIAGVGVAAIPGSAFLVKGLDFSKIARTTDKVAEMRKAAKTARESAEAEKAIAISAKEAAKASEKVIQDSAQKARKMFTKATLRYGKYSHEYYQALKAVTKAEKDELEAFQETSEIINKSNTDIEKAEVGIQKAVDKDKEADKLLESIKKMKRYGMVKYNKYIYHIIDNGRVSKSLGTAFTDAVKESTLGIRGVVRGSENTREWLSIIGIAAKRAISVVRTGQLINQVPSIHKKLTQDISNIRGKL